MSIPHLSLQDARHLQLAAQGQSIFDVTGSRVARDLEQWQGICDWLDEVR